MAAVRSTLAMISSRSFCSEAAASMGRRGMEIRQVFGPVTPRTPTLRPSAVRNPESWRYMSTECRVPTAEAWSILRRWWQRAKDRVKNADEEDKSRVFFVYGLFTLGTPSVFAIMSTIDLNEH